MVEPMTVLRGGALGFTATAARGREGDEMKLVVHCVVCGAQLSSSTTFHACIGGRLPIADPFAELNYGALSRLIDDAVKKERERVLAMLERHASVEFDPEHFESLKDCCDSIRGES